MYALLFAIVLFSSSNLFASLGDSEDTVESDRQSLSGSHKFRAQKSFTVHEITTPNGITVKEYVNSDGNIFGVTWRGPVHPDIKKLLGGYHAELMDHMATKPKNHGHGHEKITTPNIVYEHGGHMRDVRGRAYVPSMIPEGVSEGDIE